MFERPMPGCEPTALGLYVHVPFCATACDFCAFVQSKPSRQSIADYQLGIVRDIEDLSSGTRLKVDTQFWGGGTPGVLTAKDLETLGKSILKGFDTGSICEWTVEMAPATVTKSKLEVLKNLGVTRISMGVQTFDPSTLVTMGRAHSTTQVFRAWEWIQSAGFRSTNIDLIIAFPGQKEAELQDDLCQAIALAPDHLSTYCLTFEEDTPLYAKLMQGIYKIDLDREADLYSAAWKFLEQSGYSQYEVSNFAKPGHESIHNLNTWRMQEWLGLGPSAASQYRGWRFSQPFDSNQWLHSHASDSRFQDIIELDEQTLLTDCMIFGLRMNEGIDLNKLVARFPGSSLDPWVAFFEQLILEGLAVRDHTRLALTLPGRLKADAIGARILELCPS
jgi:oxygen-independent coproporphyrinogen-3 oxidase